MSNGIGPIYTGAGIPIKGFEQLTEITLNATTLKQKSNLAMAKAIDAKRGRIEKTMDDVWGLNGAGLAPGLRPFWTEYVDGLQSQLDTMVDRNGQPITSITDGMTLAGEAVSFYNDLKGYQYNRDGDSIAGEARDFVSNLIQEPDQLASFSKNLPVDKVYSLSGTNAWNQLAAMDSYADYGFLGASDEEMMNGSYIKGGYRGYGRIDYSSGAPALIINQPSGVQGLSQENEVPLTTLPIYGQGSAQLYNIDRFSTDRPSMTLFEAGEQFLLDRVASQRKGLPWDKGFAEEDTRALISNPDKNGQSARYAMLAEHKKKFPAHFNADEARAFMFLQPELAFGMDKNGASLATVNQISDLQKRFDIILSDSDMFSEIVRGSNYDRNVRTDAKEEEGLNNLNNVLATMNTVNPNDIYSLDDIQGRIERGDLFQGTADQFNAGYARLIAQNYASLGGGIQPGSSVQDLLLVGAPSWRMVGTPPESAAGITRQFVEGFGGRNLPSAVGNFSINMTGSSQNQFSPQTGVEGTVDNVYFMDDGRIGVKLNKSGITGGVVSSEGRNVVPIEGSFSFGADEPLFSIGTSDDGGNFLQDLGVIGPNSPLLGVEHGSGSPDLVFYLDPIADKNKLVQLGSKLDDYYGVRGKKLTGAMNPELGYVLNTFFKQAYK